MDKSDTHLLQEEVESWMLFANSLRSDDKYVFKSLIEKVCQYSTAIESSGKRYTVEPFFLTILLIQQRTINRLQTQLNELQKVL